MARKRQGGFADAGNPFRSLAQALAGALNNSIASINSQLSHLQLPSIYGQQHNVSSSSMLAGAASAGGGFFGGAEQTKKIAEAQKEVAAAFERSKQSIMGWAQAGLAGTTMGERLTFQQQLLRREITQLFLPAIEKVSEWLWKVTQYFRDLSGEQQTAIGKWLLTGAAMLGVLTVMPRMIAGLEQVSKTFKALGLAMSANPFVAVGAALAVILAQSEAGRETLADMGKDALAIFEQLAEMFNSVLGPALQVVSEFLSGTTGKIVIWSAVFVAAVYAVKAAFSGLALTMLGAGSIVGGLVAAVGLLAIAFQKSETSKFGDNIARQVRTGKISLDEALRQLDEKQQARQFELEEEERSGKGGRGLAARGGLIRALGQFGVGVGAKETAEAEINEERDKARRAAAGAKKRNELLLSQTAQEDPKQTIQRIQSAALRIQTPTDKNTEALVGLVQQIINALGGENKDNRDKPPKAD